MEAGNFARCTIPADGVPLFLSDNQQTLLYDLMNARIIHVPVCRGFVRVDWNQNDPKPLKFQFSIHVKGTIEELQESTCWFRIDQFVEATSDRLVRVAADPGTERFMAERGTGGVETLQINAAEHGFRFTSQRKEEKFAGLELEATSIGQELPPELLAFPDVDRLSEDVTLIKVDAQSSPAIARFLQSGQELMAKYALAAGSEIKAMAEKVIPDADWESLREQNREFGSQYRAALSRQGITLALDPLRNSE